MNWFDDLRPEDLPERYREMAGLVGVENTLRLADHYAKQNVYFIGLEDLIARKKKEYIFRNFDGANHKELARATGYSERWVYEVLKNGKDDRQSELF
jgi:Mor family transcriptional regulator